MKDQDTQRKEQLREALICHLADRAAHKFSIETLTNRIRRAGAVDGEFDESHVADALAVLEGFGLVKRVNRPLSGLVDYKATSEGVTFRERQYP